MSVTLDHILLLALQLLITKKWVNTTLNTLSSQRARRLSMLKWNKLLRTRSKALQTKTKISIQLTSSSTETVLVMLREILASPKKFHSSKKLSTKSTTRLRLHHWHSLLWTRESTRGSSSKTNLETWWIPLVAVSLTRIWWKSQYVTSIETWQNGSGVRVEI